MRVRVRVRVRVGVGVRVGVRVRVRVSRRVHLTGEVAACKALMRPPQLQGAQLEVH